MVNNRVITAAEAIRDGLAVMGERDASVLLFAEGVDDPVEFWGTLRNLADIYGPERMIEMPVAENGLCGVAIGAAQTGKRPVISFQRTEFALLALEQIFNNAAKSFYASNGQHNVPIVLRLVIGRGWGQGPAHSQSLETMFAMIPGLKVIMPAYPLDSKGMLIAAIEDNNPVVVIEHRWCHYVQGEVPDGYVYEAIDGPRIVREGSDLTVVATSYMTLEAMRAAEILSDFGASLEVVDLRVVRPLNMDLIEKSVVKTGRLMTVDTGFVNLGIGAEIVARIAESGTTLKSPPARQGLPGHPTPSSRGLAEGYYPDAGSIIRTSCEMLQLSDDILKGALAKWKEDQGELAYDVPDPHFRGPF